MINGVHALIYAEDANKVRAFFKDVLRFNFVDAGEGWLVFALPPAELGVHPAEEGGQTLIHLMCDDIEATVSDLEGKGVEFTKPVTDQGWGLVTALKLPGGGELGLYEPRHATALNLGR
jgi:predicted enzyme related to lactoylglutathione lyase